MNSPQSRNWALFGHLSALVVFVGVPSFVGPLVVWLVKRGDDPFAEEQSREALNFNLSVLVYAIVGVLLAVVATIATAGLGLLVIVPVAIAAAVAWVVLVCIAGFRAGRGEPYRYPVTIRFLS